jgi:hypothetical protein
MTPSVNTNAAPTAPRWASGSKHFNGAIIRLLLSGCRPAMSRGVFGREAISGLLNFDPRKKIRRK